MKANLLGNCFRTGSISQRLREILMAEKVAQA